MLPIKINIDFDEIDACGNWDVTLGELIKNEIEQAIKAEVKKSLKSDGKVRKAIELLRKCAVDKIISEMGELK